MPVARWETIVKNGVQVWYLPAWGQVGVLGAFTARRGGVSPPPWDTLNLGLHVGDEPKRVRHNREIAGMALGLPAANWVSARQVHGSQVKLVGVEDKGRGALDDATVVGEYDALMTAAPGVPLAMYFADCVPLFFLDPLKPAIAVAHAGWRGTLAGVATTTLAAMGRAFGTDPTRVLVAIGPSIGPCCYEVGPEVVERVKEVFADPEPLVWRGNRCYLDLWTANRLLLTGAGVPPENVVAAEVCTSCHPHEFFSHRASGGTTGRMAALLCIVGGRISP